jgi:hypothetical protein
MKTEVERPSSADSIPDEVARSLLTSAGLVLG